jgi:putative membrane protein
VSPVNLTALLSHPVCAGWGWGPGPWILIFPFLWFLLIGFLVFGFARRRAYGYGPPWAGRQYGAAPDPVSVLADRYARGEIDEGEYRRRLDVLRGGPVSP